MIEGNPGAYQKRWSYIAQELQASVGGFLNARDLQI